MSASQQFAATPKSPFARISTANTNRDGTGTIVTVYAGSSTGDRIDDIFIKAESTTTAGMVRLFISLDNGTTWKLWKEVQVSAVTPSGTVTSFEFLLADLQAIFQAGSGASTVLIGAAPNNAEAFIVRVTRGGAF